MRLVRIPNGSNVLSCQNLLGLDERKKLGKKKKKREDKEGKNSDTDDKFTLI